MSKTVNYSDSIVLIPDGYSSANSSYSSINSSYPITNAYDDSNDTSDYAYITCNTGSGATTYISFTFSNIANIPSNATIDSITAKARVRVSSTSYISTAVLQLYNGTTAMGSSVSARTTTATQYTISNPGTWTRDQLDNLQLRYTGTRGTSNTSSSAHLRFYGADITINYSVNGIVYEVTATSATENIDSYSPEGVTDVEPGDDYTLAIFCDDVSKIRVKDNGTDVTSSLVYTQSSGGSATFTGAPVSFDSVNSVYNTNAGDDGVYSTNVISNGLTDHTSSTRCALYTVQGSGATSVMYYNFDCSSIPVMATITSVSCQFKGGTQGSSYYSSYIAQLCSGTTARGTSQSVSGSNSSPTTVTINGGSGWTRDDLDDIKIKFQVTRGTSNTTTDSTFSFFGATLTVEYTLPSSPYYVYTLTNVQADHTIIIVDGSQFVNTILTTNKVSSIVPEGSTELDSGDSFTLRINATSLEDIKVTDNGEVVTSQVTEHTEQGQSGSPTFNPASYDSGTFTTTTQYPTSNGLANTSSTSYARFTVTTTAQYCIYNFNVTGIPANATITSVSCSVKAYATNAAISTRNVQLYSGTTAMGAAYTLPTSSSTFAITNPGTWTADQLANAKLRFDGQRTGTSSTYYIRFYGATLTINYTVPGEKYYTYTISSVTEEHTIVVADDIMDIPEEDENYNYYSVTVSSINATTTPGKGTTRVRSGTNQTIMIYPSETQLTLLTDNGVDITNQLIMHGGTPTYTVTTQVSDASYGFTLNNSTGYYVSNNNGVNKSAAVCRVNFDLPARCLVTISYINYAESTYDFGIFGNIDTALNGNYKPASGNMPDSSYKLACNTAAMNTSSVQTITYEISADEHYIDIKFSKDDATSSNNDTLQWKITSMELLDTPDDAYYEYDLSNITQDHSLIFIFGNVTYYFVNSEGTNCRLFPAGSMVQLPGDKYEITVIPDDPEYDIKMTDNNVDVTSSVVRKEVELEKDGNTYTVVNFIYTISNVQATHNLVITCGASTVLYIKINNAWVQATKIYKKISGTWVEQTDYTTVFDPNQIYVSGS